LEALRTKSLSILLLTLVANSAPQEDEPAKLSVTERARRDLGQIEVMVDGPADQIGDLRAADFRMVVNGIVTKPLAADGHCSSGESTNSEVDRGKQDKTAILMYFDQQHLTFRGRDYSLSIAKQMIQELVPVGSRISIMSSGQQLKTLTNFTADIDELTEALDRLRDDPTQLDDYASTESTRQEDVVASRRAGTACARAKFHAREETQLATGSLELLSSVLGRFINEAPPKIAIYFGDTLRAHSGRHYYELAGGCNQTGFDAIGAFDLFTQDASAYGVRVYSVQAAGLLAPGVTVTASANRLAGRDAQSGLKALALDTGGEAFLGGMSVERMLRRIKEDADCLYVLSFDPAPFPLDEPLPVRVEIDRPNVKARTRSRVVLQSDSVRKTSELLAAFSSPEEVRDRLPLTGAVIPLERKNGRFRALVQAILPQSSLPGGEEWDLGMSLVFGRSVRSDAAGRIRVDRVGVSIVLESEMAFRPGPFEVLLVGQETKTQRIASGRIRGEWPSLEKTPTITEIAVLQPASAVFMRGDESRTKGTLAVPVGSTVRSDAPTMILTLVCRGERKSKQVTVQRTLTGEQSVDFEPATLAFGEERCVQVRDVIPKKTMTGGTFQYSLHIDGTSISRDREIVVTAPALQ
jgi:VWFA-related protein